MNYKKYDRDLSMEYAKKWSMGRNPKYYNFDSVGGDCTAFASQVIYAGTKIMNYSKNGWYYINGNKKAPAWSGVEYLYRFLINNSGVGPFGKEVSIKEIEKGDIIQLSFGENKYHHTLIITNIIENIKRENNILIATHTEDAYDRRLSTYTYEKIRFIKVEGARF